MRVLEELALLFNQPAADVVISSYDVHTLGGRVKYWRIKPRRDDVPLAFVTKVIAGIGTEDLAQHMLEAMQPLVPASHCTLFALESTGRVSALSTASAHGAVASITAIEYYSNRFDLLDNNMTWLARKRTPARSQLWMSHQFAEDVSDPKYRELCYTKPGIRERASVLLLDRDGLRAAISFYRNLSFDRFSGADFETIAGYASVLYEAVLAHVRKTSRRAVSDALHHRILTNLAHRERQVISYVLAGKTSRETAALLELSETTVLTYRYRAFAKLGVKSQRELLTTLDQLPANLKPIKKKH
jgi:DNA-binding CsgD family transcriptional regulator